MIEIILKFANLCWANKKIQRGEIQNCTYRIDANTTADSIITAPRVNSNTKAPKYLNLNNITAS